MKRLVFKDLLLLLMGVATGISVAAMAVVLAGYERPPAAAPAPILAAADAERLEELIERIRSEYVEPVSEEQLLTSALKGMVADLDAHSQYLDRRQYDDIRISTSGAYSGIGLEVQLTDGRVTTIAPIEGTPAARAGIRPGDVILSIDGVPVDVDDVNDSITRMRGPSGSSVRLTVARAGLAGALEFELQRRTVEMHSVRGAGLGDGYAYVRITQFSDTTAKDVRRTIEKLRDRSPDGLRGLVLDLRGNPGGVLEAAVEVADAFLQDGLIVTAHGRTPESTFRHEAAPGDLLDGAPIAILVNAGSASASEIVAGALRDHGRAVLVGTRTFGKGSVQTVMPLSKGRAVKLTTSRYVTPAGISIHGQGIVPDVVVEPGASSRLASIAETRIANTGSAEPGIEAADDAASGALVRDRQLRHALSLLKGEPPAEGLPASTIAADGCSGGSRGCEALSFALAPASAPIAAPAHGAAPFGG